jgi:hypothetical protein
MNRTAGFAVVAIVTATCLVGRARAESVGDVRCTQRADRPELGVPVHSKMSRSSGLLHVLPEGWHVSVRASRGAWLQVRYAEPSMVRSEPRRYVGWMEAQYAGSCRDPQLPPIVVGATPDAGAASPLPEPRISPFVAAGPTTYALSEPAEAAAAPARSALIDLMDAFADLWVTKAAPLEAPVKLTLLTRDGSCVVDAPRASTSFLQCPNTKSGVRRRALVAKTCQQIVPPAYSAEEFLSSGKSSDDPRTAYFATGWAIEGDHAGAKLRALRSETKTKAQRVAIVKGVRAFVKREKLDARLGRDWDITAIEQMPGLDADLVVVGAERPGALLVVRDGTVLERHDNLGTPAGYFEIAGRTYLDAWTVDESRHLYVARGDRLEPVVEDGLFLFCGDGSD